MFSRIFRTKKSNQVILRTNTVIVRTNPVICMKNPVIFRTNAQIFSTNYDRKWDRKGEKLKETDRNRHIQTVMNRKVQI